jgi:hypothetical protein
MTNPRIYKEDKPKTFENINREATEQFKNRLMPTEKEIENLLKKADTLETRYFQLRAKAIIGLVKIYGKRRAELCLLEQKDIIIDDKTLYVSFTILKKSKRGLFQYLEFLRKKGDPELLNKPYPVLQQEHKLWNQTKEGSRLKRYIRQKQTPTSDKYAMLIIDYYNYLQAAYPTAKFFFPSGKSLFGYEYLINKDKALTGRQILNIIKQLDPNVWMHLFRKNKGSEVARKYGRTLDSAFQVKETLDLERTETALRYIEEFVPKVETGETLADYYLNH